MRQGGAPEGATVTGTDGTLLVELPKMSAQSTIAQPGCPATRRTSERVIIERVMSLRPGVHVTVAVIGGVRVVPSSAAVSW